jgi:2-oxoisovalerate dehydrogenase E1 component
VTGPVDDFFRKEVTSWHPREESLYTRRQGTHGERVSHYLNYFDAQLKSRHLDFAARWLQEKGRGFYTIGSAGHESNAAIALALRTSDPAFLHYRSAAFYLARAGQVPGSTPLRDVLLGVAAASDDPISGGRHKVFGNLALNIVPQTSTIASHLPRAVGAAFALGRSKRMRVHSSWPDDAVVVCSFGDASANHSTAVGALNAASYCSHQAVDMPIIFVCEDNGYGISVKSPPGWLEASLSRWPDVGYRQIDGSNPEEVLAAVEPVVHDVRKSRRPQLIHLKTVRLMGHAGSDAEIAYRRLRDIEADYARDPLLATARLLHERGYATPGEIMDSYEEARQTVMNVAEEVVSAKHLDSAEAVMEPLTQRQEDRVRVSTVRSGATRNKIFGDRLPERRAGLTLAQAINASLADALVAWPEAIVFGEDVAVKGGVYGVTRGLRKKFGATRVFDTLLDEQTILGTALGASLAGLLPLPEIQYLAYLHNAEDQLRGEGATLRFFSAGQYENGIVVRVAGLAYQKGFGGHFHNDNSVTVLRDIPGLVMAVPSHPADAPGLLRSCLALAKEEGRVCVYLEPIARYHTRDLHEVGDQGWTAPYGSPAEWSEDEFELGSVGLHGDGQSLLVVTFGNGLFMSLRAAKILADEGIDCTVLDLRWICPVPAVSLLAHAGRFKRVLVVDETRHSGGVSEGIVSTLVDGGFTGELRRVTSSDSVIPLGPAADHVLLSEAEVIACARQMFA